MYKRSGYLLILIILLCCKATLGQHFALLNYTSDNGLPSNTVYNIFRDHNGMLWFGTDKGMATFDGTTFSHYTTFDGLADNEIFFFQEDYANRVWMSTFNAILSFYKGGQFYKPENAPYLSLPMNASVTNFIILEADSSVSMGFLHYPIIVNIRKTHRTIIDLHSISSYLNSNDIISVCKKNANCYQVYTITESIFVDTNARILSIKPHPNNKQFLYSINQNQEYFLSGHTIYSKTFHPLFTMKSLYFKARVHSVYNDGKNFYVANEHGLFINNDYHLLPNIKVSSITQDINGNYWIGTLGSGAYMLSKDYLHTAKYENSYRGKVKYAHADSGRLIYITTENKLYQFNNGINNCLIKFPTIKSDDWENHVQTYLADSKYCYAFNGNNFFLINLFYPQKILARRYDISLPGYIKNMYCHKDNFYLVTPDNVLKIPFRNDMKSTKLAYKTMLTDTRWRRTYSIGFDNKENFWFSTIDSVFFIDTSGHFHYLPQFNHHSLRWGQTQGKYMICRTSKNELLIATWINNEIRDTLIQQACVWNDAYPIDSTHLLIGTDNQYRLLTLYPRSNGLHFKLDILENPFVPLGNEYITADNKNCYFFKKGSITSIAKSLVMQSAKTPIVNFAFLKAHGKIYSIDSTIQLPYSESRNITIKFDVISFEGSQFLYEYSLTQNGIDVWHNISGRELNLVAPTFGSYEVKVRAKSASSGYSKPASFFLIIGRPYWASWWFAMLLSLTILVLLTGLAYYIFRYVLRKKQHEHEVEIKVMKSEYKALNALMNPHFMFNSLNSIQHFINSDNKISASKYLSIFSKMLRQNMLNISKEMISLQSEIDIVINYLNLEKLRFKDWLNYSIDIDENLELELIKVPPLLLQPIVENALKHGLLPRQSVDNHLHIKIANMADHILIEITDNGVGLSRNAAAGHKSFALDNIKSRISQLHIIYGKKISFSIEELHDENGAISGTRSSILISY